jgi:hypothetical protein
VFEACVHAILKKDAASVLQRADTNAAALHSGPGRKAQIEESLRYLREKAKLYAVPNVQFTIGSMLSSHDEIFPAVELMRRPFLVFDPSGTRKDEWNERGIKDSGPYDQRSIRQERQRSPEIASAMSLNRCVQS